ncbi:MAG: TonB-dependent receptor [Ignavibacterium sp.]|nr:TonB-dependent receptor [Ignavibacterium sp.]
MIKYLTILVALLSVGVNAQHSVPPADKIIKGVVIDSSSTSVLPYANITLHNNIDSAFITGASSGVNGEFVLNNISDGDYYLKISFVGYNTKFVPDIRLTKDKKQFDLGSIRLSKAAYELSETQVVGEKVSEELHLDKKVINVAQNLNVQGGTALDVLQNQPSVRVDPDGTVYLRGSSNFNVLVNGKPYPLQGSDALKQISANSIENIELITNPSSRYDAEGSAGIININLKVQKEYSLSGILNLNSGTGDKYNADFSVNYNVNGLNLTSGFDYRDNIFMNEQNISRTSIFDNQSIFNSTIVNIRNKRKQYSFRGGADYTIDTQNSLGLNFSIGAVDMYNSLYSKVSNLQLNNSNYSSIKNRMDVPVKFVNSSFTYQYKINPDVNDLNLELTHSYVDVPNEQLTFENRADENYNPMDELLNSVIFSNNSKRNEGRAKLNYKQKFSEGTTFESGLQSNLNYRKFDLVNKIFDKDLQEYMLDSKLTNSFKLRNNVYSGFVSFNSEVAGFSYMLGLRGEYMDRFLDQQTLEESYKYQKMDYFPSVNISRKIDDHQIQLSYSRRINRPNENLLNPFPFYSDPNITIAGNPKLKPEYIDAFELNYQKTYGSIFVSAQTYYRKSKDSFTQTFLVDTTGRLNIIFNNYGNSDVYGAELSSSFSLFEIIKLDPSVNLFQTHLDGLVNGISIQKDFFNWSARLNTTVSFSADTRFQLSGNYMKFIDAQSESDPFMMISASIKQDFFEKNMSLTLQARNLFKASDMKINTNGSNFDASAMIRPESPVFTIMFSYNFNNFKRSSRQTDNIDVPTGL